MPREQYTTLAAVVRARATVERLESAAEMARLDYRRKLLEMSREQYTTLAAVMRARATVERLESAAEMARLDYRRKLVAASKAGNTKSDMARELGTSESRVRQDILRGMGEAS